MAETVEQEVLRLREEVKTVRSNLALVTAQKIALESHHGKLPPSAAPRQEQDMVKLRREVGNLQAEVKDLKLKHEEKLQALAVEHEQEVQRARSAGKVQASELRATISSLSQEADLLKVNNSQLRATDAERAALLAGVEEELATALLRITDLETERDELVRANLDFEATATLLTHEREELEKVVQRLQDKLARKAEASPKRGFSFGRAPEPQVEDIKASPLYQEVEAALARSRLETKIAEQLAGGLQKSLSAARAEVELLRAERVRELSSGDFSDASG